MAKLNIPPSFAGFVLSCLIKALGRTLRWRIDDRAGLLQEPMPREPVIWLCWHNRILFAPVLHQHCFPLQRGAALTSASRDGEVLAATCGYFGIEAARGSSSRRGAAALRESLRYLKTGHDLCITPDGPRGPRYHLAPGVVLLAQVSGVPVMPVYFQPARAWRLKSWDGFVIPKPFSKVEVVFLPLRVIPRTDSPEAFEAERAALEAELRAGTRDE